MESYRAAKLKFEREYLRNALREAGGKAGIAATLSGIERGLLYKMLQRHPGLLDSVRREFAPMRERHAARRAEMRRAASTGGCY